MTSLVFLSLGYVHTNVFSFVFVFGNARKAYQRLSVDITVFTKTIDVRFHLDPLSKVFSH